MEYRADGFSDVMRLYQSQTAQTGEMWIPDYDLAESTSITVYSARLSTDRQRKH